MTENKKHLLSDDDELLLQSFFADNKLEELPDKGFSKRVMQQLPTTETSYIYHLWSLLCLTLGIICFIAMKGWLYLPSLHLPHFTINLNNLQYVPMVVGAYLKAILNSQVIFPNVSIVFISMIILSCVWIHHELTDRDRMSY